MSKPETRFKDRLRGRLTARGAWTKKIHGERAQEVGVDLYVVLKGVPAALELKVGNRLDSVRLVAMATDLQLRDLLNFCRAGGKGILVGEDLQDGTLLAVDMEKFSNTMATVSAVRQASKESEPEALSFGSCDTFIDHIFRGPVC